MNIMFLSAIDAAVFGGVESWSVLAAESLAQRGHHITIISRPGSELLRRAPVVGDKVRGVSIPIADDFNLITITRLKKLLKRFDIDLVVTNRNKDLRLGGLAARWHGRTKVLWRLGVNLTRRKFIHRLLTPRLFDGIVTPSQALKDEITQCGYIAEDSITVIPNGVKDQSSQIDRKTARSQVREKYGFPSDCRIVLGIARLVGEKGLPIFINAAAEISKRASDVRFLLLGDGPLRLELNNQIKELGLAESFTLAGHLDDYEMELAGADIFAHSSLAESFGNVLLDAMRAGLPVVATRVGGIPEVFGNSTSAILVPPGDQDSLARAINNLLDNPDQAVELGKTGRELYKKKYTSERMTDRLENYMNRLVD